VSLIETSAHGHAHAHANHKLKRGGGDKGKKLLEPAAVKKATKIINGFIRKDLDRIEEQVLSCEALKSKRLAEVSQVT